MLNHSYVIDSGSNMPALAEQWFGIGIGADYFLVLRIEDGVDYG